MIQVSEENGINISGTKEKWDVPNGILCMVFGSLSVYSILFGIGYILYGQLSLGFTFLGISIISVYLLMIFWKKMSTVR